MPSITQSVLPVIRPKQTWQGVQLFCTTRAGGVGEPPYDSFNLGLGTQENPTSVHENRRRLAQVLPNEPAWLKQVHGMRVVDADNPQLFKSTLEPPAADASVTVTPGRVLAVLTADCLSVVLADQAGTVVGVAHAGWKGALYGVVENTIAAMEKLGAARGSIHTAIGACIRQASYEVGAEYIERFVAEDRASKAFFAPSTKPSHAMFDLPGYVKMRLAKAGVGKISDIDKDTCSNPDLFFSCRRAFLKGETGFGNGLSAIRL